MKILVIVDMQNDFIDGALANEKGKEVTNGVLKEIKNDYDMYLLTRDSHNENYLKTLEGINLPIEHCIINSDGWKINESILKEVENTNKPYKIFDKNGFGSYELVDFVKTFENELEFVTVVGLCTDICVITEALMLRAKFPGLKMYFNREAMFGVSKDNQDAGIRVLEACQIYDKNSHF